jgi:hypothetical protein
MRSLSFTRPYRGFSQRMRSLSFIRSVGAGLLAKAVCQARHLSQANCLRGQARSYSGFSQRIRSLLFTRPYRGFSQRMRSLSFTRSVGAGLLANAVGLKRTYRLTHLLREQAHSHRKESTSRSKRHSAPGLTCAPDAISLTYSSNHCT